MEAGKQRAGWRGAPARRGVRMALGVAGLLLAVYLLRAPLLTGVAGFLSVEDPPRRSDYIVLLNGDGNSGERARRAAQLYRQGLAPRVVIVRDQVTLSVGLGLYPSHTDVNVRLLQRFGVPDSAIVVLATPGGATSTTDEGRVMRRYLGARPARIIVVTTRYHTRRARWNFRRALRDRPVELRMAAAPTPHFDESNWWRVEGGLITYVVEYLKFAHNLLAR